MTFQYEENLVLKDIWKAMRLPERSRKLHTKNRTANNSLVVQQQNLSLRSEH